MMNVICTIAGALCLSALAVFIIASSIVWTLETIHHRKQVAYAVWAKSVCAGIDRWCNYEFPQVAFTAREMCNAISSGYSFDDSAFRDKLRRGEWKVDEKP